MLKVSPSTLGNFFFLDCERMLRYSVTPEEFREGEGIPKETFTKSVVTEAIIERGKSWEEKVVQKLQENVITGPGEEGKRFCDSVLSYEEVISALKNPVPGKYLYQAHLEPSEKFYQRYGIRRSEILFSPCRPDLIHFRIWDQGRVKVRVIDIKASDTTKFSHCVQTALYALILRDIMESENISTCLDMEVCNIWLLDQDRPEEFEMDKILVPLETFLCERLPKILLQPANMARWSLAPRCEWCGYLEHCREEAENKQDVSLLPYFPRKAKYFLNELANPVNSISDLEKFLERDDAAELFRTCGALAGSAERLKIDVKSILSREKNEKGQLRGGIPIPYGGSSIALPKGQNVGIVFTLHQDPITGGIFAAGIHIQGGKEIHGQDKPWTVIAQKPEPEAYEKVVAEFLARLEQVMWAIHGYNMAQKERQDQKNLQCYVYGCEERTLLDDLLANALKNPALAQRALSLFYYFQSERLTDAASHTASEIPFPVIVLTDALRELIALPVPVTYKLTTVSVVLKPEKFASFYSPKGEFSFAYSNRIKTDVLFEAWKSGEKEKIDKAIEDTKYELEKRLKATFSIMAGLRERLGDSLFIYPPKFFLPEKSDFKHSTLSKLSFLTRYEEVLTYLEIRSARTASRHLRLESGTALRIQLTRQTGPKEWEAVIASESSHIIPEAGGYMDWLLCKDDEEGNREQMGFCDFWYREQPWISKRYRLCFATIRDISTKQGKRELRLEIASSTNSPELETGQFYLLHERYTDYTSKRILKALRQVDEEKDSLFLSLVESPDQTLRKRTRPKGIKRKSDLANFLAPFNFTDSQRNAFIRILDYSHQLLWGPPGTGKTHFLGLTVLALTSIFEIEKKNIKVLVTAFTHAAIENCLKMIHKLFAKYRSLLPAIEISKLGEWKGVDQPKEIINLEFWSPGDFHQVVGATIYTTANEKFMPEHKFDLLIIDEGSQLKVAEASIPISRVEKKTGRLVIAGDDKQLGPIVKGVYAPPEQGELELFGSIFECLRSPDKDKNAYTSQLMECFRMNDTLCRFPAKTIYGEDFLPADTSIASSRIELTVPNDGNQDTQKSMTSPTPDSPSSSKVQVIKPDVAKKVWIMEPKPEYKSGNDWIEWVLCPDYSLILLVLEGVPALAENPVEAEIVAELAVSLRNRLLMAGIPYTEDDIFWQRGLFIVSPHHVQIQRIHWELCSRRSWKYPPFVETVNKMQGQESDCVIVSYGVSDEDYALKEGEFIYSLNRLNVAITRAKKKAIICLPAPLLTPPLSAFSNGELLEGLDFMLRLRQFVSETGEKYEFSLPQGGKNAKLIGVRTK